MSLQKLIFKNKLDGLMSSGERSLVGLDIGQSAVKLAQVKGDEKSRNYTLDNYISIPLPEGAIIESEIQQEDVIIEAIQEAFQQAKIKNKNVCMSLNGSRTLVKKVQVSGGTLEEIEDQVAWESEQYLPWEIEDTILTFHSLGENAGGGMEVLVAAALKKSVEDMVELARKADCKVKVMDMGLLAIFNVLELAYQEQIENAHESSIIIETGSQKSFIIIFRDGKILFAKEVNVGGSSITEEIQRRMGVNHEQAEELKIIGDGNGNLPEEVAEIVENVTQKVCLKEIKNTLDFYISTTKDQTMNHCFISGGNAQSPNFISALEKMLSLPLTVINPFERMALNEKKIAEEDIENITYRGIQAIGLGMRRST